MTLRPYQSLLIERTREAFSAGYQRPLVVLPCGAGKTVCFAYMAHSHVSRPNKYVWFLVHRRELIAQTLDTFARMGISTHNIYVGMVGTALSHPIEPTLIIFDEAHHATARTWSRITEAYPSIPVVGLTATPTRLDGRPLGDIYDTLISVIEAETLTTQGYLAPYEYYAPKLASIRESDFITRGSDFDQAVVGETFIKNKIYGDIAKYIDPNKKIIIYSPSVEFSKSLASEIHGVVHFDGNTPTTERDRIIQAFRCGEIRCLTNVDLIGEGFDVPDCDTVILLRPTLSLALYIQQSMRCMRPGINKIAAVYDLVGNCYRHGLPTEQREWDLKSSKRVRSTDSVADITVRQCGGCMRVYAGSNPICPYCGHNNGKTRAQIEADERAELEKITELKRVSERREIGMSRTLDDLIRLGEQRGYKNPRYWALQIMRSRGKKI